MPGHPGHGQSDNYGLIDRKAALNRSLNEGLAFRRKMLYASFALEGRKESMNAFIEKRPANFNNR